MIIGAAFSSFAMPPIYGNKRAESSGERDPGRGPWSKTRREPAKRQMYAARLLRPYTGLIRFELRFQRLTPWAIISRPYGLILLYFRAYTASSGHETHLLETTPQGPVCASRVSTSPPRPGISGSAAPLGFSRASRWRRACASEASTACLDALRRNIELPDDAVISYWRQHVLNENDSDG